MVTPLAFGFVLGLQHAFEPDHLAAISSLIAGKTGVRRLTGHGMVWGLGHLLTLSLVGGVLIIGKMRLDDKVTGSLTLAAGAMLIGLGLNVFYRLLRDGIHLRARPRSGASERHYHAHSHGAGSLPPMIRPQDHNHDGALLRAFAVGIMHGLAGSGAMAILAAITADTAMAGIIFLLLFGIGATIGMGAMSTLLAVPLTLTARSLVVANRCLQVGAGGFALIVGTTIVWNVFDLDDGGP